MQSNEGGICNLWVFPDDHKIRCYLPRGHEGFCREQPAPYRLVIEPFMETREIQVTDDNYRKVSRGDGIFYTVPKWIADVLERAGIEST